MTTPIKGLFDQLVRTKFPVTLPRQLQVCTYWSTRRCSSSTKNSFWFTLVGRVHQTPHLWEASIVCWEYFGYWSSIAGFQIWQGHNMHLCPCLKYPSQWLSWANIWLVIPSLNRKSGLWYSIRLLCVSLTQTHSENYSTLVDHIRCKINVTMYFSLVRHVAMKFSFLFNANFEHP